MFAMSVQPGRAHGIDVGACVRDVLWSLRMQLKDLWLGMGYREGSFVTRATQGQAGYPLDVWKLLDCDEQFLRHFFFRLLAEKRKARMAKADLPSSEKRGVA